MRIGILVVVPVSRGLEKGALEALQPGDLVLLDVFFLASDANDATRKSDPQLAAIVGRLGVRNVLSK